MKRVLIFLIFSIASSLVIAQDWPDWRGAKRDAVWNESGILNEFESDTIPIKWSVTIGPGYSGPTVANGKVYVSDRIEKPVQQERVLCFDEKNGAKLWEFAYDCEYFGVGYPAGPRASVVIRDGKVYSLGTMGHLFCFDAASGEVVWKKNLNTAYEIVMPIWGIAATPLLVDDKIIVHVSGSNNACIVAFNKNTGKEIWRNLEDRAGYSAPLLIEKNGKQVVVNWTEHSLSGLNPENGEVYWRFPWKTGSGMSIATPVLANDHIFVSAFYSGSILVKLGDDYTSAEKVWQRSGESERKTDALHCVMNTPVILGKYIYGVDSYGELRCLDFFTGDRIWEDQTAVKRNRWANIHFIQHNDKIWMFNEQGELLITELSPEGFTEISRAKLIEPTKKQLPRGVTWSHPAFANKHVFIRNDNKLICADLSEN
ncbi:PQQ-binding-like beta-propeller repeat protein [Maribellus mangrovi]|uniref:PQQ-binding-like beta-propeller repeat protein n=1 Tax=Maribellus mangrovi TaxID=3133146 RepID=UPI0030EB8E02